MRSLFEQMVDCCGLAPAFARRVIREACERSGVSPEAMTPADLLRTLPQVQQALSVFLDAREVAEKTAAMRRLVRTSWPGIPVAGAPAADTGARPPQDDPSTKSTS